MLLRVRGEVVESEDDQPSNCVQEVKEINDPEIFLSIKPHRILI